MENNVKENLKNDKKREQLYCRFKELAFFNNWSYKIVKFKARILVSNQSYLLRKCSRIIMPMNVLRVEKQISPKVLYHLIRKKFL